MIKKLLESKEKPMIKSFQVGDSKQMAAMCTSTNTYKIKHAENTNTFYVMKTLDDSTVSVEASTQIQIEFSPSKTKVY